MQEAGSFQPVQNTVSSTLPQQTKSIVSSADQPIVNEGAWCVVSTSGTGFMVELAAPNQSSDCFRTAPECSQYAIRGIQQCRFDYFLSANRG